MPDAGAEVVIEGLDLGTAGPVEAVPGGDGIEQDAEVAGAIALRMACVSGAAGKTAVGDAGAEELGGNALPRGEIDGGVGHGMNRALKFQV